MVYRFLDIYHSGSSFIIDVERVDKKDKKDSIFISYEDGMIGISSVENNVKMNKLDDISEFYLNKEFHYDWKTTAENKSEMIFTFNDNHHRIVFGRKNMNLYMRFLGKDGLEYTIEKYSPSFLQLWEQANSGPYLSATIDDLNDYENPFQTLDYVYHDGSFMESMPMQIDILFPVSKREQVIEFAKTNNISISKLNNQY